MAIEEANIPSMPEVTPENAANQETQPDGALPDFITSPDATLGDKQAAWRHGNPPDYSRTRQEWAQTKLKCHPPTSLEHLVENLVKNWEVEASFKTNLSDWRTIDHEHYTFSINGGTPQSAEHMLHVGTYNAILPESEYYSPSHSDFNTSHKTFKRMMPTFAWEVLEVYSPPPKVTFKWRHWGTMKNDYVGFNDKGEKVTAKAHGGPIEIVGVTIGVVNDKMQLQSVDTYFDPGAMFRQIAPDGGLTKEQPPPSNGGCPFASVDQSNAIGSVNGASTSANGHSSSEVVPDPHASPTQVVLSDDSSPGSTNVVNGANGNLQTHRVADSNPSVFDTVVPALDPGEIVGGLSHPQDSSPSDFEPATHEADLSAPISESEEVAVWFDCDGHNSPGLASNGVHPVNTNDLPMSQDAINGPERPSSISYPAEPVANEPQHSGSSSVSDVTVIPRQLSDEQTLDGRGKVALHAQEPHGEQDQVVSNLEHAGSSEQSHEPLATQPQSGGGEIKLASERQGADAEHEDVSSSIRYYSLANGVEDVHPFDPASGATPSLPVLTLNGGDLGPTCGHGKGLN